MVILDHSTACATRSGRRFAFTDALVSAAILVTSGLAGAFLVGGFLTLLVGQLTAWSWTAIVGFEVVAALFVAGALHAAGTADATSRRRLLGR